MKASRITIASPEQLATLAGDITKLLDAALPGDMTGQDRMQVLSQVVGPTNTSRVGGLPLTGFLETYLGLQLAPWVPKMVQLHQALENGKHTSFEEAFDLGSDASVYGVPTRTLAPEKRQKGDQVDKLMATLCASFGVSEDLLAPGPREARMLVLTTQSELFIVVLNKSSGAWSMHIRKVWLDLTTENDCEVEFRRGPLDDQLDRPSLTPADLVCTVKYAEHFSDALPGQSYPARLPLAAYLGDDVVPFARDKKASAGLQYGDHRDNGYLLSIEEPCEYRPARLENPLSVPFGALDNVLNRLGYAYEDLVDND